MLPKTLLLILLIKAIASQETDLNLGELKPENVNDETDETAPNNDERNDPMKEEVTTTESTDYDSKESYESTTVTEIATDVTDDYIYKINSTSIDNEGTAEITSAATIKTTEQEVEDDIEVTGQRNPKTEKSEPELPETRTFDAKPHPPVAISRSSTLKSWLEDSWLRPPAGILVPLRPMALNRALAVWNDLNAEGLNVTDVVIVGYDSNGVNWRSRHNLQSANGSKERNVQEALSKLLLKYQGVRSEASADGVMKALGTAAKLVPYDSALFVITDKGPGDPQRLPLALRALVEKRLKVYTIWTDPDYPSLESEASLQELKNISQHTEGDILPYAMQVMDVEGPNNSASDGDLHWDTMELKQPRRGRINTEHDFERYDMLLVRRGGGEAISLGLPVEGGVTALKILIEGAVEHAVFYPPNDAPQIDLYNDTSVATFSTSSRTEGQSPREVYLVFPGAPVNEDTLKVLPAATSELEATMVGVWHLSVRCDTCDYRLCVSARSNIHLDVKMEGTVSATIGGLQQEDNVVSAAPTYAELNSLYSLSHSLKIKISGPVASVRESLLVDEYGTELAKLSFSYQPLANEGQDGQIDSISELVADVQIPKHEGSKVYVKLVGRDFKGEPFVRLSGPLGIESRQSRSASIAFPDAIDELEALEEENNIMYNRMRLNDTNVLPSSRITQVLNQQGQILTAVQIGLSSRLYGSPGDILQLHFEVSNYREQSVRFDFKAEGELRFLTGISPTYQTIASGQTANVIVSLRIRTAAQPGSRDLITFTAYSNGQDPVSMSAYVYVINPLDRIVDVWSPEMRHTFQGSCLGRMGDDCAIHTWSATVIARDSLGGLLRLSSSPQGLMYNSNYISGTKDEVIATYRSTCCAPRVMVSAVDSYGNVNSYLIDITYHLTDAAIAAIVLGVLLLIAIILLTIYLIYYCVRRRKESRELPYSTSSRNIS